MKLISKLAVSIGALMIATSSFAGFKSVPDCPTIQTIKSEGVTMAEIILEDYYAAFHLSQYNGEDAWAFLIAPVKGDSAKGALDSANALLATMNSQGIPEQVDDIFACSYETGVSDVGAFAVPADDMIAMSKVKQFLKKAH